MHTGMMWLSTDANKSLEVKIQEAVDYYVKKYEKQPNLCLVHPSMMSEDMRINASFLIGKLTVRPYRPVLPGHIWIGIEDKN